MERPLHILYVVQYFNLPSEPGGGRAYHFATHWAKAGHRVTVVTGTVNTKTASVPEKYRGRSFVRETLEGVDGVELVRCASSARVRGSPLARVAGFLGFAGRATWAVLRHVERPDVVYASSTPLTVGIPGLAAALRFRRPLVFEVRDLWPESAVIAGVLKNRTVIALATWFERLLYRRAARIVAVTRGIEAGIVKQGVPAEKLLFLPNGVDDVVASAGNGTSVPPPQGVFRVAYVGALGRWNGNETLIEAATLLKDEPIEFVIVGNGDQRAELEARAQAGNARARFLGALPKEEAISHIRAADACVICTWNHPFHAMVLANKIFDYLGAGKPVLAAARGEMEQLLTEARAGLCAPPGDAEALAAIIRRMRDLTPAERLAMGERGRAHVLAHYRRSDLARKAVDAMQTLGSGRT